MAPSSQTPILLTGSCACNHVQYTSTRLPSSIINCHCTQCRKLSGSPYQSFAEFAPGSVSWVVPPTFRRSSALGVRSYCQRCGSSMSMTYDFEPEQLGIVAGTINDDDGGDGRGKIPKPRAHIFVKEKASWFEIPEDGAERWDAYTPDVEEALRGLEKRREDRAKEGS